MDDAKTRILRQADVELQAEQHTLRSGLAATRDLRWMLFFSGGLLLLVFAAPYGLPDFHAMLFCYYGAIVGLMVSVWGIVRSGLAMRHREDLLRFVAFMFAMTFVVLAFVYGSLTLSPTLDKRFVVQWPGNTTGLRRK